MPKAFQLVKQPIVPASCHSWNPDRSMVAVSPNNNDVNIYNFDGTNYTLAHTLQEHTSTVTGIDWTANGNKIVTCGQDRNAYVWTWNGTEWIPQLVILRINRAATCVKWSPNGKKFAVASGARLISICYFEDENNWWVSKHIKKPIRSTITSLDWHPNNVLLAAGSTDFKCRVFSAYVKDRQGDDEPVDEKPAATNWGKKMKFGELMAEFGTASGGGWIHDVCFSHDGERVVYVGHDSSVYVAEGGTEEPVVLQTQLLPLRAVTWVTPTSIVAAGYGCMPYLFRYDGGALSYVGELDSKTKQETKSSFRALDKFRNLDSRGTTEEKDLSTNLNTVHQNAIIELSILRGDKAAATDFCTIGADGKIVLWSMDECSKLPDISFA
jgi:actin related protein 2/3 complex subunit 1A/1B